MMKVGHPEDQFMRLLTQYQKECARAESALIMWQLAESVRDKAGKKRKHLRCCNERDTTRAQIRNMFREQASDAYVAMNVQGQFRGFGAYGFIWVDDLESATHYARKRDAENVHQGDDDVQYIMKVDDVKQREREKEIARQLNT